MLRSVALAIALVVTGIHACQPPDCDHPDCGGCANACCELGFSVSGSTAEKVNSAIVASLKDGGADGRYTFVGDEDLTKYKIPGGVDYLLQAIHTTKVHHYNDTLNFVVASQGESVMVKGFSISQIYGAYCDDGQNYKNLVGFMKGVSGITLGENIEIIHGCSNKTSSAMSQRGSRPHRLHL